ncbi:816_t:CDS:2 [Funneliformis mosseae]|uniref:816_t:CDS:1 n=1 Tax=Funneliformis mosseae TaxID=27381 RepID=A0A9N8VL76_FUNMO|nr:816_t:CDS:2 [Funneliformis mosseae]
MSQDYYGRSTRFAGSWSVVNNELYDDDDHRFAPSYATDTWSVLGSQDINEDRLSSLPPNFGALSELDYGSSTSTIRQQERDPSSPPELEPEFFPSISSTRNFLETTERFERRRQEDIVGRPDEFEASLPPPSYQTSPPYSDITPHDFSSLNEDSQSNINNTINNIESTTSASLSSWIVNFVIAVILASVAYYIKSGFSFEFFDDLF